MKRRDKGSWEIGAKGYGTSERDPKEETQQAGKLNPELLLLQLNYKLPT